MSFNLHIFELKVKIAVLWILFGINLTIDFTLKDFTHSNTSSAQQSILLVGDAFIRLIPFVFAFLTLALKDVWIRYMNLVLGIFFTVLAIFGLVTLLFYLANSQAYDFLIQAIAIITPILIFWYAYKWPKEEIELLPTNNT